MRILGIIAVLACLPSAWAGELFDTQQLMGKHRDEIIADWGPPTKTKKPDEQHEILIYKFVIPLGRLVEPGSYKGYVPAEPDARQAQSFVVITQEAGRIQKKATLKLYLDRDGRVIKVKQRGKKN